MATLSDGNFTGVRASLGDWLARSDLTNTDYGNFIYLFEKEFNTEMRLRGMEGQTTPGVTSGYIQHPSDFLQWKSLKVVEGGKEYALGALTEENAAYDYGLSFPDRARGFVIRGDKTYIYPIGATGTYTGVYFQGVPALNASNTTNWLLTKYPQLYLYGPLLQAQAYVSNPDKIQLWNIAFEQAKAKVFTESQRASFGGGLPTMRPDRFY